MNKCAKYFYSLVLFFLVISLFVCISYVSFTHIWMFNNYNKDEFSNIRLAQENGNFSVTYDSPKLIWIECQVSLNITSNRNGNISIRLQDSSGGNYFSVDSELLELDGTNQSNTVLLRSQPQLFTLPGNYEFSLDISGALNYNDSFSVILGMGYLILLLVYLVVLIAIPIILTRKVEEETYIPSSEAISTPVTETDASAPAGKIKCPECRKEIDEGLTFCPDCGARIPEFLQFSPSE